MSFAFPTVDPETAGTVHQMDVPLSRYLDASYSWANHDNVLNAVSRMQEISAADADQDSPMLSPEEAAKKWGVGNLKFDQPIRESTARILNKRKRDEMDRQFFLTEGHTAGRFIPGFAAGMLGAISNPIDLGLMFVPFVGEERLAAKMTTVGGKMLARRLVTREFLQQAVPQAPHLTESVINGVLGQTLFEIPNLIASHQDQADYGPSQALLNIGVGGAFAATLQQLGRLVSRMGRGTREEMMRTALNQALRDEPVQVHQFVKLDEAALWHASKFDEVTAASKALSTVDMATVKESIKSRFQEDVEWIAVAFEDGHVVKAKAGEAIHISIPGLLDYADAHPELGMQEGFITSKGRFVDSREEAGRIMGTDYLMSEQLMGGTDPSFLSEAERSLYDRLLEEGKSNVEAHNEAMKFRAQNREEFFFQRPEIQELVQREVDTNVKAEIERMRKEYDQFGVFGELRRREIDKQIAEGRTMTPEEIVRHSPPEKFEDMAEGDVTEEIAALKKDLGIEEKAPEGESKAPKAEEKGALDQMIDKVESMIQDLSKPSDKMFTGITGLEPLIAMVGKEVAKGLLVAVREGLKLTKDLAKAIDHAMEWFEKEKPYVVAAAIRDERPGHVGKIYTEASHPGILNTPGIADNVGELIFTENPKSTEGFALSDGTFIGREKLEEALGIDFSEIQRIWDKYRPKSRDSEVPSLAPIGGDFVGIIQEARGKSGQLVGANAWRNYIKGMLKENVDKFIEELQELANPRRIIVQTADGEIHKGTSHGEILEKLRAQGIDTSGAKNGYLIGGKVGTLLDLAREQLDKQNQIRAHLESAIKSSIESKDFTYTIQSELAKPQPFNVKPERFTPQVIMARLKNLPGPEQAMLKMAGLEEHMAKYKPTEMVDREAFSKFVDSAMIEPEIRPMLNVAEDVNDWWDRKAQHELETAGYTISPEGKILVRSSRAQNFLEDRGITNPTLEQLGELHKAQTTPRDVASDLYLEKGFLERVAKGKKPVDTAPRTDILRGDYVSQNVSVPIAFEKMEKPRTIFLAADQQPHVGSSHYSDVFPSKKGKHRNMLAWMETHVVTMPDGRRVLHVFEAQSDVRQSFSVESHYENETGVREATGENVAYYLDDKGRSQKKAFPTQKEAQAFVDQKLREYQEKVQPLIDHTDEILMKAAVKLAKKEGLDGVVISDPRTAMLTQGHLGSVGGETYGGGPEDRIAYTPPSQAAGMTQAYGQKLPGLLKKSTGSPGEAVEMGPEGHYQYQNIFPDDANPGPGELSGSEIQGFNKAFPGSDSPSGTFFPVKQLPENRPFEMFTPKMVEPPEPKVEAIEAAIECVLKNLI